MSQRDSEKQQYHDSVLVMWDKKAWFNSAKCNEWVMLASMEFLFKSEGKHLIICDNLSGQTTDTFVASGPCATLELANDTDGSGYVVYFPP